MSSKLVLVINAGPKIQSNTHTFLTLKHAGVEGGGFCPLGADIASISSIFIKNGESCLMSAFTKISFGKLRMTEIGPSG